MSQTETLLFEIGTEELPAKGLNQLANMLGQQLSQVLSKAGLTHGTVKTFATPRRLAVLVSELSKEQPEQESVRKGPQLTAAFDDVGKPTPAALGFARSCGVAIEALTQENGNLIFHQQAKGQKTTALLPELIKQALEQLNYPRSMRWGTHQEYFLRPVRWLVLLYGDICIPVKLFGLTSDRVTYGHRFHAPSALQLNHAEDYLAVLEQQGYVIADANKRLELITEQIQQIADSLKAKAVTPEGLLEEVTGLVEWPVALLAGFDASFLTVPHEALISAMQMHQQCFALVDSKGQLLPHFITVSNIASQDSNAVIKGNERVMHARLSDAAFFYHQDCQQSLDTWLEQLKQVTFQLKLGSLHDKSRRIANLAMYIAEQLNINTQQTKRAGLLAKTDLMSTMVGEFPELQGIMGYHYALYNNEAEPIAKAIREHYLPRFAGDELPASLIGCAVALADRLDSLVGLFAIKQPPTGDKDPFGLRRAAIGVIRIIIEHKLELDVLDLLRQAQLDYSDVLKGIDVTADVLQFLNDRLRVWLQEQNLATTDSFAAVISQQSSQPFDCFLRLQAVHAFRKLPVAQELAAANKRVSNILAKADIKTHLLLEEKWLETEAEQQLAQLVATKTQVIAPLLAAKQYTEALTSLAELNTPIAQFFEQVMVMVEDDKLRNNRLALLAAVRNLFMQVADISLLQL